MTSSTLLEKARRSVRFFCSEIGSVSKVTKITVDDDQLALRYVLVDCIRLWQFCVCAEKSIMHISFICIILCGRSVTSEEVGLTRINIAKKRIGPVQHGCGSSLAGFFFGGQVQTAEYGTTECVVMLMQALADKSICCIVWWYFMFIHFFTSNCWVSSLCVIFA